MALVGLLGEKLISKDGKLDTASLTFGDGEILGLYFSAHWCPPCRGFTPKLVDFYRNVNKNAPKLKIVFVSSDRSQDEFDEYYGSMPWLALPLSNKDKKGQLSKKCKVTGIPNLAFFDSAGNRLKTAGDARSLVMNDPEGSDFPWPQKPVSEMLIGPITDKDSGHGTIEDLVKNNTTIGFYFSAHWCPPCRNFTPLLVETYQKVKAKGHNFEIVFASSDRDEASFKEYLGNMPWKAIPLGDSRIEGLSTRFNVEGIPTLVIVAPDGKVITTNGRSRVASDKNGDDFPWRTKPVNSLLESAELLNDFPAVILFADGSDKEVKDIGEEMLLPVAQKLGEAVLPDNEDADMVFVHAGGDEEEDMALRVRNFAKLPKAEDRPSLLIILNIPAREVYVHDGDVKEPGDVQKVVDDFRDGKLKFRSLGE